MIVFQKSDLSLLEVLQSLHNKSGSVSEVWSPPLISTFTAGLINTPASATTVEDTVRNTEENVSVT